MSPAKRYLFLGSIILTSFSLALTLLIILSPVIYWLITPIFKLDQIVGLSQADLQTNYLSMWKYLLNPIQTEFTFPNFSASSQGMQHFAEVKGLMWGNFSMSIASLFILPKLVQVIRKRRQKTWFKSQIKLAIVTPLFLLFIALIGFEPLFIAFHKLFFANDYWQFDPLKDPIINVLPESFFLLCFLGIILLYELVVILISSRIQAKLKSRRKS
ncbi:TIGR01906 family membrane protein [Eremococcus coleocola]|uniref:TIGR01906 family membrane protein n=1 Tax=Eremococcus coleocola TaxID=88132 RepID=UPI00041117AE|nr:TIGR01906 family membrane protein [Eremococcus coleocola]